MITPKINIKYFLLILIIIGASNSVFSFSNRRYRQKTKQNYQKLVWGGLSIIIAGKIITDIAINSYTQADVLKSKDSAASPLLPEQPLSTMPAASNSTNWAKERKALLAKLEESRIKDKLTRSAQAQATLDLRYNPLPKNTRSRARSHVRKPQ